jgi:hypothetical protein
MAPLTIQKKLRMWNVCVECRYCTKAFLLQDRTACYWIGTRDMGFPRSPMPRITARSYRSLGLAPVTDISGPTDSKYKGVQMLNFALDGSVPIYYGWLAIVLQRRNGKAANYAAS